MPDSSSVVNETEPSSPDVAPATPVMLIPFSATASATIARLPGWFGSSTMNAFISLSSGSRFRVGRVYKSPSSSPASDAVEEWMAIAETARLPA